MVFQNPPVIPCLGIFLLKITTNHGCTLLYQLTLVFQTFTVGHVRTGIVYPRYMFIVTGIVPQFKVYWIKLYPIGFQNPSNTLWLGILDVGPNTDPSQGIWKAWNFPAGMLGLVPSLLKPPCRSPLKWHIPNKCPLFQWCRCAWSLRGPPIPRRFSQHFPHDILGILGCPWKWS